MAKAPSPTNNNHNNTSIQKRWYYAWEAAEKALAEAKIEKARFLRKNRRLRELLSLKKTNNSRQTNNHHINTSNQKRESHCIFQFHLNT